MTRAHAKKESKRYRYYVTRQMPGDQSDKWRMPAGEIERLVINAVSKKLKSTVSDEQGSAAVLSEAIRKRNAIASSLLEMNILEQRQVLASLSTRVSIEESAISLEFTPPERDQTVSISIKTKLVSKGRDLKLAIATDEGLAKRDPDPVLL